MNQMNDFISYCDDMMIAEEATKAKKYPKDLNPIQKQQVKFLAKSTKTPIGLRNQYLAMKIAVEKKYKQCETEEDFDKFREYLEKQIRLTNQKINGKEIKDKKMLRKFVDLYESYLQKI